MNQRRMQPKTKMDDQCVSHGPSLPARRGFTSEIRRKRTEQLDWSAVLQNHMRRSISSLGVKYRDM